jgi:hypothetical protein
METVGIQIVGLLLKKVLGGYSFIQEYSTSGFTGSLLLVSPNTM